MCGCALKASFASTPARSIILATPAVLKGAARSEVNTKGDFGSCSHCSRRSARNSSPRIGWLLGVPCLTLRTCSADIEPVLAHLGADGGAIFNADAFMNNNLKLAIDLAARYRVPAIYGSSAPAAKAGGLISYNLDQLAQCRQTAPYLDRILGGEKPANLPIQQPTAFQYIINLKTAKALD